MKLVDTAKENSPQRVEALLDLYNAVPPGYPVEDLAVTIQLGLATQMRDIVSNEGYLCRIAALNVLKGLARGPENCAYLGSPDFNLWPVLLNALTTKNQVGFATVAERVHLVISALAGSKDIKGYFNADVLIMFAAAAHADIEALEVLKTLAENQSNIAHLISEEIGLLLKLRDILLTSSTNKAIWTGALQLLHTLSGDAIAAICMCNPIYGLLPILRDRCCAEYISYYVVGILRNLSKVPENRSSMASPALGLLKQCCVKMADNLKSEVQRAGDLFSDEFSDLSMIFSNLSELHEIHPYLDSTDFGLLKILTNALGANKCYCGVSAALITVRNFSESFEIREYMVSDSLGLLPVLRHKSLDTEDLEEQGIIKSVLNNLGVDEKSPSVIEGVAIIASVPTTNVFPPQPPSSKTVMTLDPVSPVRFCWEFHR